MCSASFTTWTHGACVRACAHDARDARARVRVRAWVRAWVRACVHLDNSVYLLHADDTEPAGADIALSLELGVVRVGLSDDDVRWNAPMERSEGTLRGMGHSDRILRRNVPTERSDRTFRLNCSWKISMERSDRTFRSNVQWIVRKKSRLDESASRDCTKRRSDSGCSWLCTRWYAGILVMAY